MSLSTDLEKVFEDAYKLNYPLEQKQVSKEHVETFLANGICDSVKASIESGTTNSVYNGTVLGGTVAATVNGTSISINPAPGSSAFVSTIENLQKSMSSNDEWAIGLANAIHALTVATIITEAITGTTLVPGTPPVTLPVSGQATGNPTPVGLPALQQSIKALAIKDSVSSNKAYAQGISQAVLTYLSTSVVNMVGMTTLTGLGTMQGNI